MHIYYFTMHGNEELFWNIKYYTPVYCVYNSKGNVYPSQSVQINGDDKKKSLKSIFGLYCGGNWTTASREKHWPDASHWQALSYNEWDSNLQL